MPAAAVPDTGLTCDHERMRTVDERTLQFGPLWVLSALSGTYTRFDEFELAAFWDSVVEVALRAPEPTRGILTSTAADRPGLLLDFALDGRPVVSGLSHVVELLDRLGPPLDQDYRSALMAIGAPWPGRAGRSGAGSPRTTARSCCCSGRCWRSRRNRTAS